MKIEQLKFFYNKVLSQTISTSGKYLFAGNRFGDIFVQSIDDISKDEDPKLKPKIFPQGEKLEIYCLTFHRDFLIVGTTGIIFGLKWNEELCELSKERQWKIKIPLNDNAAEVPEVNSLWLDKESDMLYAGCSDNLVYQINLEDGRIVRNYAGHTDFIHTVTGNKDGQIFTASEDGTVRFWTSNAKESINQIEPGIRSDLSRPNNGKSIQSVAVNENWLLCGGGPQLSIWNIKSLDCMRSYNYPGVIHVCDFVDDDVFVAGEGDRAQLFNLVGDIVADIPVENTATYSIVWQSQPIKIMSIAGFSNSLHILKDFRFIDCKIELYKNIEEEPEEIESDEV